MSEVSDIGEIKDNKRALRKQAVARRDEAAAADDGRAGTRLAGHLEAAAVVPAGAVVSGFWPIGSEFDVWPALNALVARGHPVALPVVAGAGRPLEFRLWRKGDAMATGPFGIREPLATAPAVDPEVLLVPLLAFDRTGYRLGYGGGFYDRSLAGLRDRGTPRAIGVGWSAQEVPAVPRAAYDQPLDWIVTERESIRVDGGYGA